MRRPSIPAKTAVQKGPADVDAYMASLSPEVRKALQRLRATIRAAAPGAVDSFSYGVPAIRIDGKAVVGYAAARAHYSLFPMSGAVMKAFATDLEAFDTSRGTIRFRFDRPLPSRLVRRIIKARMAEMGKAR